MRYSVSLVEKYKRDITVEASNPDEAWELAFKLYLNGVVETCITKHFKGYEIEVTGESDEQDRLMRDEPVYTQEDLAIAEQSVFDEEN